MNNERKSITLNLRVELIEMIDALALEWHTLRPGVFERVIASEYRTAMRKRAQQPVSVDDLPKQEQTSEAAA
jgi:hypothetical protein